MPTRRRKLVFACVTMALAGALVVAVEIGLRLVFPGKVVAPPDDPALVFHPEYLVALRPGVTKVFPRFEADGGETIRWSTNAQGFRGGPLRDGADGDLVRVMVYGDSNVQARFSTHAATFPAQLERALGATSARPVEVVNAGVVGFGPDQSLLRLRDEVTIYRPDLVVFHVFADNDFGDLLRNRLFDLDAHGAPDSLVASPHPRTPDRLILPTRLERARRAVARTLIARGLQKAWRAAVGADAAAPATLDDIATLCADEHAAYMARAPRTVSVLADHYDLDVALEPDGAAARDKAALMAAVLAAAYDAATAGGAAFVVVIQPSSRDLTTNLPVNHRTFARYPGYRRTNLTAAVERVADAHGMHVVNLYDAFAAHDPATLFFRGDNHWNDAGQALAAREVADFVTATLPRVLR